MRGSRGPGGRPGIAAPLRIASFRWLAIGSTVSRLGNGMAPIALAFGVLDLTHSFVALGLVVASRSLANVLFLLFGGVLADRLPRSVLLVGTSLASACTQGAVALLLALHGASLVGVIALSAMNGAVSAVSQPAVVPLVRDVLPDELLASGNALFRLGLNGAGVVGQAIAGALVAALGSSTGIAVDAATFAIAGVCFSRVRVPSGIAPADRPGILSDLAEGWHAFRTRSWLWSIVAAFAVVNACYSGSFSVLAPAVADETFGRAALGLVLASFTLGFLAGGVLALRARPARPLLAGVIACLPYAVLPAALAVLPVGPLIVLALLAGVGTELFEVFWQTALQTRVTRDLLARVASFDLLGSFSAIPIGQLAAGPIAHAIGATPALLAAGTLAPVAFLLCLLVPGVRETQRRAPA